MPIVFCLSLRPRREHTKQTAAVYAGVQCVRAPHATSASRARHNAQSQFRFEAMREARGREVETDRGLSQKKICDEGGAKVVIQVAFLPDLRTQLRQDATPGSVQIVTEVGVCAFDIARFWLVSAVGYFGLSLLTVWAALLPGHAAAHQQRCHADPGQAYRRPPGAMAAVPALTRL